MQFSDLVATLHALEQTSSRNLMTELLADFLGKVSAKEVLEASYLLLGQLGPLYKRVDFGMADRMVVRSIAFANETSGAEVLVRYKEIGDLGEVAHKIQIAKIKEQISHELTVDEVYQKLMNIATASGEGSQEVKTRLLADLLNQSQPLEAKYLIRMVLGKMRLGFSDKTILDALSVMAGGTKEGRAVLDWAYQVSPDIGLIATLVKEVGIKAVAAKVKVEVGVPVMPALAQRLKTADEMITKMGKVTVEPKYDGTRVQIHFSNGFIKTYARSLEETTAMFPELEQVSHQLQAESAIIDCEAIGYDPDTGILKPFQETITRKRKHGIEEVSKSIPVKFFCFDLLFLNGESLLQRPLYERRQLLKQILGSGEVVVMDEGIVATNASEIREYHQKQLDLGLEGAMIKKHDGEYQPGRTGWNWVKFKEVEDAHGKLRDTIDGLVLGYYRGRGKRSAFGIGAFLLGVWDENKSAYVTVAKIGTGLSDEQWREIRHKVDSNFATEKPINYEVEQALVPDVWADPVVVVEVAADEITKSPLHSSGWGLRFPRLVRFRDDKLAHQVTQASELLSLM